MRQRGRGHTEGKSLGRAGVAGTQGLAVEGLERTVPLHGGTEGIPACAATPRDGQGQAITGENSMPEAVADPQPGLGRRGYPPSKHRHWETLEFAYMYFFVSLNVSSSFFPRF